MVACVEKQRIMKDSGQIYLNGVPPTKDYRRQVAYMHQDDCLYGNLTVWECVEYSAMLRLPNSMSVQDKRSYVWKTLEELHLLQTANNFTSSLSGGERKRVSIGMELVSQPLVLALDEPTSGLDSSAALNIMCVLSELASKNRIVILSLHQPSTRAFFMMDRVIVIAGGHMMYSGKPLHVEAYLDRSGFPCSDDIPIADHMLTVVSNKTNQDLLKGRGMLLSDEPRPANKNSTEAVQGQQPALLWKEIIILFSRTAKVLLRNRELCLMQATVSVVLAIFTGAIFNGISNNLAGFQNRLGVSFMYECVCVYRLNITF
jgi:ABC-type multidrug transport system ATPase subunit